MIWNVPAEQSPFFGRSSYLDDIKTKISDGTLVIMGLSGIGKTSLAEEYARRNHKKYQVVWRFNLSKEMDEQMTALAHKLHVYQGNKTALVLKSKEDAGAHVKNLLRTAAFSWLLIFDNAPNVLAATEYLPETHGQKNKHTLVTSLSGRHSDNMITVTHFTDGEAASFLAHYLPNAEQKDIKLLASTLENHPLAMYQAALYIKSTPGMDIPAYVEYFTKHKDEYWRSEKLALGNQPLLYTAIKMSIDRLQKESPEDYTLLVALSLLETSHLDRDIIQKAYRALNDGQMGGFGKILDVALISQGENEVYKIHDYVRDVILKTAPQETLRKAATLDANMFRVLFPENIEDCMDVFEKIPGLSAHMKKLVDHMDLAPSNEMVGVALRLFYYADFIERDFSFTHPLSEKLKIIVDRNSSLDPYLSGVFYNLSGTSKVFAQGVDAAIIDLKRADEFLKKADPVKVRYERVMLLANNLGFFLHWKGDIAAADACLQEAKILQKGHEEIFPQTAICELEAALAMDRGTPEKAIGFMDTELALLKKDPTTYRVDGHFAKSLKGCALLKLADLKECDKKFEEAASLRREAHTVSLDAFKHAVDSADGNDDAEIVGRTLLYLSQSESALGDFHKAEASAKKVLTIFQKEYGTPNRRQAVAHMALGDAYMGQKRHKEALMEYMAAERIFDKISSHKAFDDLSELYLKIVKAYVPFKDREKVWIYHMKHREIFPLDHLRYYQIVRESKKVHLL
ncbi:MAG: tetratricopeptide repeat protein [Alphaproteobacteria bacterium]